MNFTREPIIETIITPREGSRLVIRSSQHGSQEEFTVDAVEVVSFGQALFFRSLEKPRPFLVPVGDYEVVEAKESRVVLKNAQFERTIKIGGGREGSLRREEEAEDQILPVSLEDEVAEESDNNNNNNSAPSKQRDNRRRHRRRRSHEERDEMKHRIEEAPKESKPETPKEASPAPSFTHLIPPPTTLISQSIHRYKEQQSGLPSNQDIPAKKTEEPKNEPEGDSTPISRTALEPESLTTHFTNLNGWNHFLS